MKKIISKFFIYSAFIYFGILFLLFFNQKSLIYFPGTKDFYDCKNFTQNEQKEYNNTKFYEVKGEKNGVVVFFHGNAGRACDRSYIKSLLKKTKYNLIFVEYSGYSDPINTKPNIENILKDVENIGEYVQKQSFEKIFVVGRSIGTGPASFLTKINNNVQKIILISPYSQLYKIGAEKYPFFPIKYVFSENYNSQDYLKNYKGEVLIIHGEQDITVPYKFGIELYDSIKTQNKEFLSLKNANHNNIFDSKNVENKILDFLK